MEPSLMKWVIAESTDPRTRVLMPAELGARVARFPRSERAGDDAGDRGRGAKSSIGGRSTCGAIARAVHPSPRKG